MTDDATDAASESSGFEHTGRSIELAIEVPGTPEEVWRAIATDPGITSWYVHHEVEERAGGSLTLSFGPGMDGTGRVAVWEPPHRVVFDGSESTGLAFEWIVEAREAGSCVVRLVNSGFLDGDDWDAQYDGMRDGWPIFLWNLQLHLTHFSGRSGVPSLPMARWQGPQDAAWARLLGELGITAEPVVGERVEVTAADAPPLAGIVQGLGDGEVSLLLDQPTEGTAFIAAELVGGVITASIWSYLYGDDAAALAERDGAAWAEWLGRRGLDDEPR